jgi:oligopeptide/dipeptide ABC transporter ATP-binding protein
MAEPILKVRDLVKHFPGSSPGETIHAVNGVSFDLMPGETVGLVGESGSGKSTIGRCVVRLYRPTAGTIQFGDRDITTIKERQMRPLRKEIQIVFQDPYSALNPRMKVGNLIGELVKLHTDLDAPARRETVAALAARVHLNADLLTRFPNELSGGQLQRVCIARALATNPKVIVLDEPTSSLDLSVRAGILELLGELQRETGVSMLFISHDLETVELVSHRILVLYLGSVVEDGPSDAVFANPSHPYTQALLSADLPPDPDVVLDRKILQGEVPGPVNLPTGCPFEPRCPIARPDCSQAKPPPAAIGDKHHAACVRVADGTNDIRNAELLTDGDTHKKLQDQFIGRTS